MGEPVERTRVRESQKEEDGEVASKSKLREREHELTAQRKLMTSEERADCEGTFGLEIFSVRQMGGLEANQPV